MDTKQIHKMDIRQIHSCCCDLVIGLFDRYRVFYRQPSDPALAKEYIRARLDNGESKIFVAFVDNIPAGFTQLYPGFSSVRAVKNWILNDLYVDPAYRRQNIGEALIRAALDCALEDGARYIELETGTDNYIAQSLYQKMGFARQEPETGFYTYRLFFTNQNHKR